MNASVHGMVLIAALGFATVGCGASNSSSKQDPRLVKRDDLLARLRAYQEELNKAHFRFKAAATNYEQSKDEYQKKLTLAMASKKASGKQLQALEKNRGQLAQMIQDRDRVGQDLSNCFDTLISAQKKRNNAALSLFEIESKLWELEEKAVGGRAALQQLVVAELEGRRMAAQAQADTEKVALEAASAVINKEVETSALIGADVKKRDESDQALDKLRETLEAAVTSYGSAVAAYEAAKDRYHKKILASLKAGPQKTMVQQLLDQRGASAKQLDEAQNVVKTATIDRAMQTKQRIAFDSEIDHVVEAGLSTATKEAVLRTLKGETDAIVKGRTDMQSEDNSALGLQQKISGTEAELDHLAY
ncbi:MAG: hypothetical protein EXR72_22900 [Myxococcales bacterium]|nr:hypothetical protein [Myxococcales bacterium]